MKFTVTVPVTVFVSKEIEAESKDDAHEKAHVLDFGLTGFIGNGAPSKDSRQEMRLCGVYDGWVEYENEPDYDKMEISEVQQA